MDIKVKLFADLAKFLPEGSKDKRVILSVPENTTVGGVLEQLDISPKTAHLIFVNAVHRKIDHVLKESDSLSIFPAIAGG